MKPSLRQIFTMALDMKVPGQGPVQILEFMAGHRAGYKGYIRATGEGMTKKHIIPYLKSLNPDVPVADFLGRKKYIHLGGIGKTYGKDLARAGTGIVYTERPYRNSGAYQLLRADLELAARYPEFTFVNADQQMLMMENNKAAQAYLVKEDAELSRYYVPSFVTTTAYHDGKAGRILDYLNHDGDFVLKPVDQSQGNGVRVVSAAALDGALQTILLKHRLRNLLMPGGDYWNSDSNPVLLAQPYIASRPVSVGGDDYDGTLRIFTTIHRDAPDRDWTVKIHDGYWKLPYTPLSADPPTIAQRVSHSPMRKEIASLPVRLLGQPFGRILNRLNASGKASVGRSAMQSATMSDDLKAEVFPQVEAFCKRLPVVMESKTLHQRIWEHLSSGSVPRQGTGLLMAGDSDFYVGDEKEPLHLDDTAFPQAYLQRAHELNLRYKFSALSRYMQHDRQWEKRLTEYDERLAREDAEKRALVTENLALSMISLKP